jgi:hypothetical protein
MKRLIQIYLLVVFSGLLFSACRKNKNEPPPAEPKSYLKTETNGTYLYTYHYDAANRISSIDFVQGTLSQPIQVTQYNSNNDITEFITRTPSVPRSSKNSITYDGQRRIVEQEQRDSVAPGVFNLARTISYTYVGNKTILLTTAPSSLGSRREYTHNTDGNIIHEEVFNALGTKTLDIVYSNFDDKKTLESLKPVFYNNGVRSKNNFRDYQVTTIPGPIKDYSVTRQYNADGYPTQENYLTIPSTTYNYTYEKR